MLAKFDYSILLSALSGKEQGILAARVLYSFCRGYGAIDCPILVQETYNLQNQPNEP